MLFKKTDTVLQYAELTTIQFNSVAPTIRLVEQQHIAPVLGNALYNSLNNAYTAAADESSLPNDQKNLLEKCRCVIGPLLCYYYAPKAEVKLGDAGAQRMESDTNKTAYQNQVVNFREQMLREGDLATELLLQFLDENKTAYPGWATSAGYSKYKSLFIKSGSEFNDLFSSHSPYRNYMAMRSKMFDVEQNSIRPLVGDVLFNYLKTKDQTGDPAFTTNEADLLFKIKKVIAYLTVVNAIPFLNVRLDANGLTVMSLNGVQNDELSKRTAADKVMINNLIEACDASAKSWIDNVTAFIAANPTDFAQYAPVTQDSACETPTKTCYEELNGSFGLT